MKPFTVADPLHLGGRVLRIARDVVGADRDDRDPLGRKLAREGGKAVEEVFHVRTVIAEERDEEDRAPCELIERDRPPRHRIGERKARRRGAKLEHAGFSSRHGVLLPVVLMSRGVVRAAEVTARMCLMSPTESATGLAWPWNLPPSPLNRP